MSSPSHSPVILVHYTSWKFSQYFVFIFRTALNFLNKIDHSHQSSNKNILILLYVKPETTAHAQISISRYDIRLQISFHILKLKLPLRIDFW